MKFSKLSNRCSVECVAENGVTYVRFGARSWGYWAGESLELVQSEEERRELEAAFRLACQHLAMDGGERA